MEKIIYELMLVSLHVSVHLTNTYLFFNRVLKSSSPESSFPSVLLQEYQPPATSQHTNSVSPTQERC